MKTHKAICPLCESTCGLSITTVDGKIEGIRGNPDDHFSKGYICPKGFALKALEESPDRLRSPQIKENGRHREASWEEAFALIARKLPREEPDSVAVYLGNPNVHNLAGQLYVPALLKTLKTRSIFTASTLDQMPKHISSGLMFGDPLSIPIPDVDRTDYLLILGANPLVSNGSLMTAPNMRARLKAIRGRGGKVVVIDPRRTLTADAADRHHFIRPGTDALFLAALANVIEPNPGVLGDHLNGVQELRAALQPFTPEAVARQTGIPAETIRQIAGELQSAPSAAVYGRLGTCTQEFGTLSSWLVDVVNVLTGNLDRPGGAMFTKGAAGARNTMGPPGQGRGMRIKPNASRVRGLPSFMGELPAAALAEEILTEGPGQIRVLLTIAGNPALSVPDSAHLEKALQDLDFQIAVDCYINETTRHADVILPPPGHLQRSHYDIVFAQLAVANYARYSGPVLEPTAGALDEWQILLKLTAIAMGQPDFDIRKIDHQIAAQLSGGQVPTDRQGPERLLDILLRQGPYGLTLEQVENAPDGIHLGALEPRIPEVLRTTTGKIELAPPELLADLPRLEQALSKPSPELVLIGRRALRSNNSWMNNIQLLTKGPPACTLMMNPRDAERLQITDHAVVTSAAGSLEAPVELTDELMPGVVSLPHGWSPDQGRRGVNVNLLLSDRTVEPISGNAIQNAVPVTIHPGIRALPQKS